MTRESRFFDALRDVFVGAKVDGESGYINLMRIKSRYYTEGVFPRLKEDIAAALQPFPEFREELFERLYDFFHRYFSESGSIYFRHTALHQSVYEKVYTDDRDVVLFWKTHMLYYVKTDRLFRSMDVEADGVRFRFDASALEHKKANEKRQVVYTFRERRDDDVLVFDTAYSERGTKTKVEDTLRAIRKAGGTVTEETLTRAFRVFEKQSEVDYFINKDARAFLEEQFDLWMYQYLFKGVTQWTERRIKQLQVLKDIAFKIIAFIAQFEDELVKIWNKPKFVLNSRYVITLDRIAAQEGGWEALEHLFAHAGMAAQVAEWIALGMAPEGFQPTDIVVNDLMGRRLADRWQHLPLDTAHFKDLELDILGLFDHLDDALDGWLIKSENYQALNTLAPKWREQVQCIYIDPPYNADGSEIAYTNRYRSSTWLTLVADRLSAARQYCGLPAALMVAVDDYEMAKLVTMLPGLYGGHEINPIVVNHHPQGTPKANISRTHEYLVMVTPEGLDFVRTPRPAGRPDTRPFIRSGTGTNNFRVGRPNSFYAIVVDPVSLRIVRTEPPPRADDYPVGVTAEGYVRLYPIDGAGKERVWRKGFESGAAAIAAGKVVVTRTNGAIAVFELVEIERIRLNSNWYGPRFNAGTHGSNVLSHLFPGDCAFAYPKSLWSVADAVGAATYDDESANTLDFFAGSGTTAHAVMNLNRTEGTRRKYILIEMAEYCDTVILPRIKKVAFSDKWKDGKAVEGGVGMGHFMKYYTLEQYEDTLRKARYQDSDLFDEPAVGPYHAYVFLPDLKMLDALEVNADTVKVDLGKLYDGIDVPETLSNLTGKHIRRITRDTADFEDGTVIDLNNLDWRLVKPLIWW